MEVPGLGCLVQVTTQQGNYIAEALTWVPGAKIVERYDKKDPSIVISRELTGKR